MACCNSTEPQWPADELLMKYQFISDFFIALAYFFIPLDSLWCNTLINLWTFNTYSRTVAVIMTMAKVLTAVVSCATALMLVHIIPNLLGMKTKELLLKNKAAELNHEGGPIYTQEETSRHKNLRVQGISHRAKCSTGFGKERSRNCHLTPMHVIIALSSLLQETEITPEQRLMIETILKSSNLLATLINDILDFSRLEDGSHELDLVTFRPLWHHTCLSMQVIQLVKPISLVKKLSLTLTLASDLRKYVIGDEKCLMQTILNIVGNAVKFTKEGNISIDVCISKPEPLQDARAPDFFPVQSDLLLFGCTGGLICMSLQRCTHTWILICVV
ncbi:hypothetical protein NE237_000333 [Protea cynaroides]|uniref:Signal transduction histidine kinase dimerisation/phosphoacceptor domain-containing protein n=1 Tax=Protea cynaroides TaxID=273540 RepID=A0A9Q0KR92_9MAGN|nr:hypothetical protein NE237_000333 [Protea cynaroides]